MDQSYRDRPSAKHVLGTDTKEVIERVRRQDAEA